VVDSTNSSPEFDTQPIYYPCAGQSHSYNFGVMEKDGDSLVYSFDRGCSNYPQPYSWSRPFNPPLAGMTLNSKTGRIKFTPNVSGNFVVVLKVSEYDRKTAAFKGSVTQDVLMIVQICTNKNPEFASPPGYSGRRVGSIENFSGSATKLNSKSVEMCIGDNFQFDVFSFDADLLDSMSVRSNVKEVLPGAHLSFSHPSGRTDSIIATISWTATSLPGPFYSFYLEFSDNHCPLVALSYLTYKVYLKPSTYAGPDLTICNGSQSATLQVSGGSQFTWSALPGGSGISVPSNFSCDTCANVIANPSTTTNYVVISNLISGCKSSDTIQVKVVDDFSLVGNSVDVCWGDSIQISVEPSDTSKSYSYQWSNPQFLDSVGSRTPEVRGLDISNRFIVTVTSSSGCTKIDSVIVNSSLPYPNNIRAVADPNPICVSDTVQLEVNWSPQSFGCGINPFPCQGFSRTVQVVNGTSRTSSSGSLVSPNPYPNVYASVRQQYLYRASDLSQMGMKKGGISSIEFFVDSNLGTASYHNYSIRMKCTSLSQLGTTWESGLVQVYSSKTHTVTQGWNSHLFDERYSWDGTSNLLVEICFDNSIQSSAQTSNANILYGPTSYTSTILAHEFNASACNVVSPSSASSFNSLPNTRFVTCEGFNTASYNFQWTSSGSNPSFIGANNIIDPKINASLSSDTSYTVFIEDSLGICFDTASVQVDVVNQYSVFLPKNIRLCIQDGLQIIQSAVPFQWHGGGRGKWSGPGIVNDSLGYFDPAIAGIGQHWIHYEIVGSACDMRDSMQIQVVGLPDVSFIEGPFCELDAINRLDTNLIHDIGYFTSSIPGVVDSSLDNFDATSAFINAPDSLPLTYHAFNGCWADSTITVRVDAKWQVSIPTLGPYCLDEDSTQVYTNDSLGQWSGPGVKSNFFFPSSNGPGMFRLHVDSAGYCGNTGFKDVVVVSNPKPQILDPGPFIDDGTSRWTSPVEVVADTFDPGGKWGAPTTPPWMPFTTQTVFVPSAVFASGGTGFYPLTYTVNDTMSNGKLCAGADTVHLYFCVPKPSSSYISTNALGDLVANPKSSFYWWYEDSLFTGNNLRDSIFSNPTMGFQYRVLVGDSNQCWTISDSNYYVGSPEFALESIQLLPNPASDEIFLLTEESYEEIELYDVEGKLLRRIQIDGLRTRIDLQGLNAGMYFLRIPSHPEKKALHFIKK